MFKYTNLNLNLAVLLENKMNVFIINGKKLHALEKIKQQLNPDIHQHRYQEIETEIEMIKEVLTNENQ